MSDTLPVPFDESIHRPARLGYARAAALDRIPEFVVAAVGTLAAELVRGWLG